MNQKPLIVKYSFSGEIEVTEDYTVDEIKREMEGVRDTLIGFGSVDKMILKIPRRPREVVELH